MSDWRSPKKVDWKGVLEERVFILVAGRKTKLFGRKEVGIACGQVVRLKKDRIVLKCLQGNATFLKEDIFRISFID